MDNLQKIEKELEAGGCQHEELEHKVEINKMKPTEGGKISSHELSIKVQCAHCGLPFHFVGLEQGTSYRRPMTGYNGTELRAPIMPGELAMTYQTFETAPENFVEMMADDEASDGLPPPQVGESLAAGKAASADSPVTENESEEQFYQRAERELTRRDSLPGGAFGEGRP